MSTAEPQVVWEDQQRINRFGRLTRERTEVKETLELLREREANFDDALMEAELADEALQYQVGQVFVTLDAEDAALRLESELEEIRAEKASKESTAEDLDTELQQLKRALYAKFGDSINLDEKPRGK